jgi:small neutral amino acid transporter SnatA (MarC family)
MIFPQPGGIMGDDSSGNEPFIVPLAIPALAGPSALATVLLFSSNTTTELTVHIGALSAVAVVWLIILLAADRLQAALGIRVMKAFERLMGLILTAIAVEMLLAGIRDYIASF